MIVLPPTVRAILYHKFGSKEPCKVLKMASNLDLASYIQYYKWNWAKYCEHISIKNVISTKNGRKSTVQATLYLYSRFWYYLEYLDIYEFSMYRRVRRDSGQTLERSNILNTPIIPNTLNIPN